MSNLKGSTAIAIVIPIIALGLPIFDTFFSMLRRLLSSLHIMEVDQEKNIVKFFYFDGWTIFKADRNHIHHRLLRIGFTHKKAVILLYGVSLIFGGVALLTAYSKNVNYALLITAIGMALYVGVKKLGYQEIQILKNGVLLPLFDAPVANRRILIVFVDMALICLSYYFAILLRFEGLFPPLQKDYYLSTLPLILTSRMVVFYLTGLYKKAWQYTDIADLMGGAKGSGAILRSVRLRPLDHPGFGDIQLGRTHRRFQSSSLPDHRSERFLQDS